MSKPKQTSGKKDREKQKQKDRKEKEMRREERKSNSNKGKGMDSMLAYVDEFGRITSTPPDPTKRQAMNIEDIQISVPKQKPADPADAFKKGTVTFFNDSKGYGFIRVQDSQDSVFVHVNQLLEEVKENDRVTFEIEMGNKGPVAVRVKKLRAEN